jgi:antitoxin (DNA-binding transcriptional repressor) of toxin-antitoxin stability system
MAMVAEKMTVADLATNLTEVLDRVREGEQFQIERDGEIIATIRPSDFKPGITWGEFVATYHLRPRPDDRFADDLDAIQAEQGIAEVPEWPD